MSPYEGGSEGAYSLPDFRAIPMRARYRRVDLRAQRGRGFTLIETMVVVGITMLLISILMPALASARSSAKALVCASNMRSAVMQFAEFASGESPKGRGDSEVLGKYRFYINDVQDQLYGLDEFWDAGDVASAPLRSANELMLCPAVTGELTKRQGFPCGSSALAPIENVSIAFNMRLYRASVNYKGAVRLASEASTSVHREIVNRPYVPILLDVDGDKAKARSIDPFYTAPPLGEVDDAYADGRYWIPSDRHNGQTNVAFMGGHVLRSAAPADEQWDWTYQADAGR